MDWNARIETAQSTKKRYTENSHLLIYGNKYKGKQTLGKYFGWTRNIHLRRRHSDSMMQSAKMQMLK